MSALVFGNWLFEKVQNNMLYPMMKIYEHDVHMVKITNYISYSLGMIAISFLALAAFRNAKLWHKIQFRTAVVSTAFDCQLALRCSTLLTDFGVSTCHLYLFNSLFWSAAGWNPAFHIFLLIFADKDEVYMKL